MGWGNFFRGLGTAVIGSVAATVAGTMADPQFGGSYKSIGATAAAGALAGLIGFLQKAPGQHRDSEALDKAVESIPVETTMISSGPPEVWQYRVPSLPDIRGLYDGTKDDAERVARAAIRELVQSRLAQGKGI